MQSEIVEAPVLPIDYPELNTIAVSGFISKQKNIAESYVFSKLFATKKWAEITTISDDTKFARKRFANPDTIYSGLFDVLKFSVVDEANEIADLETALTSNDAWIAFNITSNQLVPYANVAVKSGLKRVVFAVSVTPEEAGADVVFEEASKILGDASIAYTVLKFGEVKDLAEAKQPYRIVRGSKALPTEGEILSSKDLLRVSEWLSKLKALTKP